MRPPPLPALGIYSCLCLFSAAGLFGSSLPANPLIGDTFKVVPGNREANSDLNGQKLEIGNATWNTFARVFVTPDGAASADTEAMAVAKLPKFEGALDLSADIVSDGSGFTALTFMPNGSMGDFWKEASLWIFLTSNGHYEVRASGEKDILKQGGAADYTFKAGAPTHVDLICDPDGQTATVKLNGTTVLSNASLDGMVPVSIARTLATKWRDVIKSPPRTWGRYIFSQKVSFGLETM